LPASGIGKTSALQKLLLCAPSLARTNSLALHTHCPPPPVPYQGMPQVAGVGDAGRHFVQEQLLVGRALHTHCSPQAVPRLSLVQVCS
jgi:hypothetical protein